MHTGTVSVHFIAGSQIFILGFAYIVSDPLFKMKYFWSYIPVPVADGLPGRCAGRVPGLGVEEQLWPGPEDA